MNALTRPGTTPPLTATFPLYGPAPKPGHWTPMPHGGGGWA